MVGVAPQYDHPSLPHHHYRKTIERANDFAPQHSRLFKEVRYGEDIYQTKITTIYR